MKTASWVIREKSTGRVVLETFKPSCVVLNTDPNSRFEAVPILDYLVSLNGSKASV